MMESNKATASFSRHQTPNDAPIVPFCGLILTLWGGAHVLFCSAELRWAPASSVKKKTSWDRSKLYC